jgi:drug/metabolite transporter (DMT)-like permease
VPFADRERQGVVLCLVAAVGFGAMAVFAKLAYRAGFDVTSLLMLRFVVAAAVLWAIVAVRRPAWPSARTVAIALGLGAFGYALQALTFFESLRHIDAGLAALLLYTYPTLVLVGAVALRRERATRRRVAALVAASAGTLLVLAGGGAGALDGAGVALALSAALIYSAYILVADRLDPGTDPFLLTALIATAAAVVMTGDALASGGPDLHVAAGGWAALAGVALVSTVVPVVAFLLGLRRVGPATASIVCTIEPLVTVLLALAVFGERLAPIQAAGGALVVGAVLLVNARRRPRRLGAPATA